MKTDSSLAPPKTASKVVGPAIVPLFQDYIWILMFIYTLASGPPSHLNHCHPLRKLNYTKLKRGPGVCVRILERNFLLYSKLG